MKDRLNPDFGKLYGMWVLFAVKYFLGEKETQPEWVLMKIIW